MKFNSVVILAKPSFPLLVQIVARAVVEDQEDLASRVSDELLEEDQEGTAFELLGE